MKSLKRKGSILVGTSALALVLAACGDRGETVETFETPAYRPVDTSRMTSLIPAVSVTAGSGSEVLPCETAPMGALSCVGRDGELTTIMWMQWDCTDGSKFYGSDYGWAKSLDDAPEPLDPNMLADKLMEVCLS